MQNCSNNGQHYLGDKVFCDVLVGEVRGLDQHAGERGVGLVKGLPTDPWKRRDDKSYSSRTQDFSFPFALSLYLFSSDQKNLKSFYLISWIV